MTAEFIAAEGPLKGLVLALTEGGEWTIGRDPDESTLVVEDAQVSRKHLLCRRTEEGYTVENLSESNPVTVNDEPISEPTLLKEGDKVSVGGTVFHFFLEAGPIPEEIPLEEGPQETIFTEEELPESRFDLEGESRFVLKVIAGPNTGAEYALEFDHEYLIGTDTGTCDVVFHDLSVSREHARLFVSGEGEIEVEDLGSRNGVVIEKERIVERHPLPANTVATLGTTTFLILDREAPAETIAAPVLEPYSTEEETEEKGKVSEGVKEKAKSKTVSPGTLFFTLIIFGVVVLLGIGMVSLFRTSETPHIPVDYVKEIATATKKFPAVQFTFNKATGNLFLMGHVSTGVEKNELLYNLQGLVFIRGMEDNVTIDAPIWQEMNILMAKQPAFQGITMHSPKAGEFVLQGYLKTSQDAAALIDFINLHFNYLDHLKNHVVVEEQVMDDVVSQLFQKGFNGVTPAFTGGELVLTGYISSASTGVYDGLVHKFSNTPGVRVVRNYVVALSPEQAIVDLNERYPGRYQVTGYSKHGDVNVNVLINGRILSRGDSIDDMTITSIQPHTIFLEKDGLKYKIEYNK